MVLSHHCALPPPKTENDTIIPSIRYVHVMIGGVAMQAHTKIQVRKFLLKAFQSFIRKFALAQN